MSPSTPAARAVAAVVVSFLAVTAAPAADLRTDLDVLGLALDRAVSQVSRPSRNGGRGSARGYRLEGYGAVFVLAPRALPVPAPAPTPEERESARALSDARRDLESRLPRVSDDVRLLLQQSLKAMRQSEEELRLREKMGRRAAGEPVAAEGAVPAAPRTLEDTLLELERDVQMQLRLQAEAVQAAGSADSVIPPEVRREIEAQMRLMNEQAQAFAAEADRARQEAERDIWTRLGQQPPSPAPADPSVAVTRPSPFAPDETPFALLPPWQLWIEPMDDATPDPQGLIQGVGVAVTAVLEQHGARLGALAPHEVVAVAIDFVPATRFGVRPRAARTLMVRAKKSDIDQRAAGRITPEEFRKRVELLEY